VDAATYDEEINRQVATAVSKRGQGTLKDLIWSGETWDVS